MFSSQGLVPVLIVDDEPPILEKLASFSWESVGCKLVGSASSYTSALRLFESAHPRIVVTDIQMPGKNGLELAQIIHENDPDVQFIFITLFSDFSYAKHAISLGASDYLVKGIYTDEDITSALEKAKQRLLTCQHSETRERVDKAQEEMELLGTYFNGTSKDWKPSLVVPANIFGVFVRYLDSISMLFQMSVLRFFTTLRETMPEIVDIKYINNKRFDLFVSPSADAHALLKQLYSDFTAKFSEENVVLFLSGGKSVKKAAQYSAVHLAIDETLKMSFYEPKGCILPIDRVPVQSDEGDHEMRQARGQLFSLQTNIPALSAYLHDNFVPKMHQLCCLPEQVRQTLFLTIVEMRRRLGFGGESSQAAEKLTSAEDIETCVHSFLQCAKHLQVSSHVEDRFELQKALELVRAHLDQPITLSGIASAVGFSPSYLSFLFKKKLNKNFKDILLDMRMERAAQLLKRSNLKVYEVAQQIGIPNYRYFVSVFNEFYKTTPKKFRGGGV